MKEYNIQISGAVDYLSWDCLRCGTHNESKGDLDTCCCECGYDIEQDIYLPSDSELAITLKRGESANNE